MRASIRTAVFLGVVGLAGCGGGGGGHGSSAAMFRAGGVLTTGPSTQPSGVVMADFDGDGRLDLAVANRASGTLGVSLGTGTGTFGAATAIALGATSQPIAVVAGDFDANGKTDLAVANFGSDSVAILDGSGTGSFTVSGTVPLSVGAQASALAAVDVNEDGRLDLVVCDRAFGALSIALGSGAGTFAAPTTVPVALALQPDAIVSGDFDLDGHADVAVASAINGNVAVVLGHGDATFGAPTAFLVASGASLTGAVAADFDRDGRLDLAVVNHTTGDAAILLGLGDGTFSTAVSFAAGADATAIASGDFDLDGRADLAVSLAASGQVAILLGHGDGSLDAATMISAGGTGSIALATGDADRNGSLDVAVANSASSNVRVLLGQDHSVAYALGAVAGVALGTGFQTSSVVLADMNADGKLDLVAANTGDGSVSVALGTGAGSFATSVQTALGLGLGPVAVATGDFDGDGKIDVAVANSLGSTVSILLGTGGGALTLSGSIALPIGAGPSALVTGDFNGDGQLDVVAANGLLGSVSVALGLGTGAFSAVVSFSLALGFEASGAAAGDFNRDGHLDLALCSSSDGRLAVLLGDGTGSFGAATLSTVSLGANLAGVAAGDFDRDGRLDLVIANRTAGQVVVMLGNGDGTFAAGTSFNAGSDASALAIGDFDRDGEADVAVTLSGTGRVEILLGNGDGTLAAPMDFTAGGSGSASVVIGDVNRDGLLDVLIANEASGNVGVELGS